MYMAIYALMATIRQILLLAAKGLTSGRLVLARVLKRILDYIIIALRIGYIKLQMLTRRLLTTQ